MAKEITYRCSDCGWTSPSGWAGVPRLRHEHRPGGRGHGRAARRRGSRRPRCPWRRGRERASSFHGRGRELDRVLGSGIVPGAVILLATAGGVGKSTAAAGRGRQEPRARRHRQRGPVTLRDGRGSQRRRCGGAPGCVRRSSRTCSSPMRPLGIVLGRRGLGSVPAHRRLRARQSLRFRSKAGRAGDRQVRGRRLTHSGRQESSLPPCSSAT